MPAKFRPLMVNSYDEAKQEIEKAVADGWFLFNTVELPGGGYSVMLRKPSYDDDEDEEEEDEEGDE